MNTNRLDDHVDMHKQLTAHSSCTYIHNMYFLHGIVDPYLELCVSETREAGSVSETYGWVTVIDISDLSIGASHIAVCR